MKTFTIKLHGKQDGDIELAAQETLRLISSGFTSGSNSNDSGGFFFDSEGEYEEDEGDEGEAAA